jgi:hypothetical protein
LIFARQTVRAAKIATFGERVKKKRREEGKKGEKTSRR